MPSADVVHTKDPLNAEPNLADLTASQVTPSSLMFHRNHGPTPAEAVAALSSPTGAADWRIEFIIQPGMEGLEPAIRSVTLKEIWDQSEEVEQTIALQVRSVQLEKIDVWQWQLTRSLNITQCAGNRRDLFSHGHQSTEGIAWEQGTVANAAWSGALLKPLLSRFLLHEQQPPAGSHVVFESYQDCGVDEGGVYGGSVRTEVMW
jgi:sulfite oxidase